MQVTAQDRAKFLDGTDYAMRVKAAEGGHSAKNLDLTFWEAVTYIKRKEGARGFLRGLTPSILKNTLNAGSFFSMLYYTEQALERTGLFGEYQIDFLASAMSRTNQTIISNPLIVVKTRLEVVGFTEYNNTTDAFRKIAASEGFKGFFTGLKISLVRDVPFSGMFYPIYNFFKD